MSIEELLKPCKLNHTKFIRFEGDIAVFNDQGREIWLAATALELRIKNLKLQGFYVDAEMAALAELNHRNGQGYGSPLHDVKIGSGFSQP